MKNMAFLRLASLAGVAALTGLIACSSPTHKVDSPKPTKTSTTTTTTTATASDTPTDVASSSKTTASSSSTTSTSTSGPATYVQGSTIISGRAFPTGDKATSAVYLEKHVPVEVILGKPYEVHIKVTNLTNLKLDNVVVTDLLGQGFNMQSSTPPAQSSSGGLATWALGDFDGGQSRTIVITGSASGVNRVTSCADVSYDSKLCLTTNVVEPKLKIVKEGPARVLRCDPITYKLIVSNNGTGAARNVKVEDRLPAGLTNETGGNTLNFTLPELAPGAQKAFTAKVMAARTGTYENNAVAMADNGLESTSNTVRTVVVEPKLDIMMSCPGKVFGGQAITYQVAVTNTGDADCTNTVIKASIPSGTSFLSATAGGTSNGSEVTWVVSSLKAGGSTDMSYTVNADTLGAKTAKASTQCVCADPVDTSCTTDVLGIPAVLLEVVDIEDPRAVGSNETYIITVTNQGTLADTDIVITCTLEDEMEYVSSSGATTGSASGKTVTFAPLPSLAPKATATWKVVVKAIGAGDVRFAVQMDTAQLSRPVNENEATNFYE